MKTLRHFLLCARNGMVCNIRKFRLLPILFSFFIVITGCNESGLTNVDIFPEITSTTPAANADSVPVNTPISVIFSEDMDSTSIHKGTFIVKMDTINITGTYSYADLTAVFIPSVPLEYGSIYSVTVVPAVISASGISLADSLKWSFTTEDGENADIPQVILTSPAHNAEVVLLHSAIKVSFDRPMNSNSLNTSTFIVYQESVPISGLVTSANSTATFSPFSTLSRGSTYRAVISSDVEDTLGNNLDHDFEWSFTTAEEPDITAPQVESVSPSDGEEGVPADQVISATFNKALDDESVNASTFKVTQNGNAVSGSIDLSGSTISFTPNADLPYGAEVTVAITTGVKDEAGNSLPDDYEWSFVIMDEPDTTPPQVQSLSPSDGEEEVPVDKVISATFSKALDDESVNSSTFKVTHNGNAVSGSIDLSGSTISFTPNADLPYETEIVVVITTGVKDEAGNNLQDDFEWSFVIMDEPDTTPPHVWSVSPTDDKKDVPVDVVISATFSEALNNATVNSSTFLITQNGNSVSGSINSSDSAISFTPNTDLEHGAEVSVVITSEVKDEAGNNLPYNYKWSFMIMDEPDNISPKVVSTSPVDDAKEIDVNSVITATFSEPMNASTINNSTFIVSSFGTVAGSISYSDNRVTFTPNRDFREKRTYWVTITTGVEDVAGNALESDVAWTFRTGKEDDDDDDDD